MTMEPISTEMLEKYVLGALTPDERQRLERALQADAALRAELAQLQEIALAAETVQLKKSLGQIKGNEETAPAPGGRLRLLITAFLLLLALAAMILLWRQAPSGQNPDDALRAYLEPPAGLATPMGASEQLVFMDGMLDYRAGNYALALLKWEKLESSDIGKDSLYFYQAAAHFARTEYAKADALFEKTRMFNNSPFAADLDWYQAVCAAALGQNEKALEYLKRSDHKLRDQLIQQLR